MLNFIRKMVMGTESERVLGAIQPIVDTVNRLEPEMVRLSDDELKAKTGEFKERLKGGSSLDDILPEAFAVVREAARRTIGLRHHDVQLAGGLTLLQEYYPQRIAVQIGYQDVSLPLLACDVFLMPSMHEPGGISQLEAFSCGAIVVARATGGLRDTVSAIRVHDGVVQGNGFLFTDFSAASFYDAMARCAAFFRDADDTLVQQARAQAARSVHYWDSSARRYVEEMYALREIVPVPSTTI